MIDKNLIFWPNLVDVSNFPDSLLAKAKTPNKPVFFFNSSNFSSNFAKARPKNGRITFYSNSTTFDVFVSPKPVGFYLFSNG